jgi:hypothetical protein
MSFTVLNACDDFLTTWRRNKKTPWPNSGLCRNDAIVFLRGSMIAYIVLGVNSLNASLFGWDDPCTPFKQSLNHCKQLGGLKGRSFRTVSRQSHSADHMRILEMDLFPGVIMIGQCLQFGFHVFNLLRRRKLEAPSISAC